MSKTDTPPGRAATPPPAPKRTYWQENLRLLGLLLVVWFVVSFGFGILLRGPLDAVSFFGVPLGFWFAQQGSTYVFVALIFIYAWRIGKIERRYGVSDEDAA
ncbi:DUF4212 domain-containing protein [Parvularcula dongshanensis]|uniref:Putative solute:sodium symporter small subunit n=1 Tax=Parvularcula dongshanensis TaxID=1173995 RepID=A0A840I3I7_9PROT|nr:DUF4212 domain-containing protein [Parvularcula dongshanensis]MBB4659566.1 putative solute:sodium symporter small subunit [Parvularcula dongshanensis]